MLANCDKMVLSSTPNQWPHEMEETGLMASSGTRTTLEIKPGQDHQQQQPLKCPRCDSSNTKFCYYNNYSLSQPRHFCKACKRYWTRGGTLRNVPVGGGYRKNKRVKRPSSSSLGEANKVPTILAPHGDHSTHQINSLFYGIPNNPNSHTDHFPFRKFHQSYDNHDHHQSQIMSSSLGLSFPAAQQDYGGGFDMVSSSNSMFSNLSLLGSSSLIRPSGNIHALLNLEGMQVAGSGDMGVMMREVKSEESEKYQIGNKMESWGLTGQNLVEPIGLSNGYVCMNPMINVGAWPDLTN